jgi:hypothetical protein
MAGLPNTKYTLSKGVYVNDTYAKIRTILPLISDANIQQEDYVLFINTGSNPVTLNLNTNDPFINGKIIIIKDYAGQASSNNINLVGNVDGIGFLGSSFISTDYGCKQLIYQDNAWYTLSVS